MAHDLEHDIRSALQDRVADITHDRLRYADNPPATNHRRPRTRRALAAPIAAAACVVVTAVVILLATSNHKSNGTPAGGTETNSALSSLIGTSWSLESVQQEGHDALAIPQQLRAGVTFGSGGVFGARDGVNYFEARYDLEADEVVIAGAGGTLAGYGGSDPATLAAISGIRAILYTGDGQATSHAVSAQLHDGRLQLTASGYTLVLDAEVSTPNSSAPPPSSTTGSH